jgi:hypothetical protein
MTPKRVSEIDGLRHRVEYLDRLVYELMEDRKFIMRALEDVGLIEQCDSRGNRVVYEDIPLKVELVVDNDRNL